MNSETFFTFVYWFAAVLTILRMIPQMIKIIWTMSVKDISLSSQFLYTISCAFWILYCSIFYTQLGYQVLAVNIFAFIFGLILIAIIFFTRKKRICDVQKDENIDIKKIKLEICLLIKKEANNEIDK